MDADEVMKMPVEKMIDPARDAPSTLPPTSTAHELAQAVGRSPAGAVLVTSADSSIDGVVTKSDLVQALAASDPAAPPPTAATIATEQPIVFQASAPLEDVVSQLGANNVVIVVNDKRQPIATIRRDQLAERLSEFIKQL
jgi:signal-transduction protein with cAMP-binding, CBS, and nucleotidyltransferase domain